MLESKLCISYGLRDRSRSVEFLFPRETNIVFAIYKEKKMVILDDLDSY